MIELLAEAAPDMAVQGPGVLQMWGPWGAVIIALGGKEGIMTLVSIIRGRNRSGNGKYNKEICDQKHKALDEQRAADRTDLVYIRGRVDEIVTHMLREKD